MWRNWVRVWLLRLLDRSSCFFWIVWLRFTAQFFINSLLFAVSLLARRSLDLGLRSVIPLLLSSHLRTLLELALINTILIGLLSGINRHFLVVLTRRYRLRPGSLLWLLFLLSLLFLLGRLLHCFVRFACVAVWSTRGGTVGLLLAVLGFGWR